MKITRREIIEEGEQDLIDAITGELDWGVIEEIFEKEHRLKMSDDVTYKSGDIVIHNNQVAYRLEFDVKTTLSLFLDRDGTCLSLSSSADLNADDEAREDLPEDGLASEAPAVDSQEREGDAADEGDPGEGNDAADAAGTGDAIPSDQAAADTAEDEADVVNGDDGADVAGAGNDTPSDQDLSDSAVDAVGEGDVADDGDGAVEGSVAGEDDAAGEGAAADEDDVAGDIAGADSGEASDASLDTTIPPDVKDKIAQAASDASDMINEINGDTVSA
ncbi:MAG: hypothetical protein V3S89_10910 [Desulfobacterales bacterium]